MSDNLSREEKLEKLKALRDSKKKDIDNILSNLDDLDKYLNSFTEQEISNEISNPISNPISNEISNEISNPMISKKKDSKLSNLISFFERK